MPRRSPHPARLAYERLRGSFLDAESRGVREDPEWPRFARHGLYGLLGARAPPVFVVRVHVLPPPSFCGREEPGYRRLLGIYAGMTSDISVDRCRGEGSERK